MQVFYASVKNFGNVSPAEPAVIAVFVYLKCFHRFRFYDFVLVVIRKEPCRKYDRALCYLWFRFEQIRESATLRPVSYTHLVVYQKPLKIRPKLLAKSITMKTGDLFTVNAQNTTLSNLNKLGIFRSVNLGVTPLDSLDGKDTLNVYLSAGLDVYKRQVRTSVTADDGQGSSRPVNFNISINIRNTLENLSLIHI